MNKKYVVDLKQEERGKLKPKNGSCARRNSTTHWAAYTCLHLRKSLDTPSRCACVFAQVYSTQAVALCIHAQLPYLG